MTSFAAPRISCEVIDPRGEDVARIFNIQRYSLNDGQGIRTVVFLKVVRIPARGAPTLNLSPHVLKQYGGRVNACTVHPVYVMLMSVPPVRLNVSVVISRWTSWNVK